LTNDLIAAPVPKGRGGHPQFTLEKPHLVTLQRDRSTHPIRLLHRRPFSPRFPPGGAHSLPSRSPTWPTTEGEVLLPNKAKGLKHPTRSILPCHCEEHSDAAIYSSPHPCFFCIASTRQTRIIYRYEEGPYQRPLQHRLQNNKTPVGIFS